MLSSKTLTNLWLLSVGDMLYSLTIDKATLLILNLWFNNGNYRKTVQLNVVSY